MLQTDRQTDRGVAVRLDMTASAPSQGPNGRKVPRNLRLNLLKHTNGDELGQWARACGGVYVAKCSNWLCHPSRWPEYTDAATRASATRLCQAQVPSLALIPSQ